MLGQWALEMNHVAAIVGGFNSQEKYVGQEGRDVYAGAQDATGGSGEVPERERVRDAQLGDRPRDSAAHRTDRRAQPHPQCAEQRAEQSAEQSALRPAGGAGGAGRTSCLYAGGVPGRCAQGRLEGTGRAAGEDRRRTAANLQRAYLDVANTKINGAPAARPAGLPAGFGAGFFAASGDEKGLYRAELKSLNTAIGAALAKASDRETKAHLEGARDLIARILDPRFAPPVAAVATGGRAFGEQADPFSAFADELTSCWPDYIIRP